MNEMMEYSNREANNRISDDTVQVKLLGRFTALYQGETLKLDFSSTTKMVQLLALLLSYPNGISREKLLHNLYGNSELADSKNNLRVTISRLRKALKASGLPDDSYVTVKEGVYRIGGSITIESDVELFESYFTEGKSESDQNLAYLLKEKACDMYAGEFLPAFGMEEWVTAEQVRLKKEYFECLEQLCEEMKQRREYGKLLDMVSGASKIYPYDEWQTYQIDALMAMNRYDDAMEIYDKTVSMYFDDLGLPPSDNMLKRLRAMSDSVHYEVNSADDILAGLNENEKKQGAYYCSFPSFIDNFRMLQRLSERDGRSCYLVICTLVGKDQKPIEDQKRLYVVGGSLKIALEKSLRRGDTYTKYSTSQYLLLLAGLQKEDTSIVTDRIDKNLIKYSEGKKASVRYRVMPILNVSMEKDTGWNF